MIIILEQVDIQMETPEQWRMLSELEDYLIQRPSLLEGKQLFHARCFSLLMRNDRVIAVEVKAQKQCLMSRNTRVTLCELLAQFVLASKMFSFSSVCANFTKVQPYLCRRRSMACTNINASCSVSRLWSQ